MALPASLLQEGAECCHICRHTDIHSHHSIALDSGCASRSQAHWPPPIIRSSLCDIEFPTAVQCSPSVSCMHRSTQAQITSRHGSMGKALPGS